MDDSSKYRCFDIESGTTVVAFMGRDSIVVAADGRCCEPLFGGSIDDRKVKFEWLYQDVYVAYAGAVGSATKVLNAVRTRCATTPRPLSIYKVAIIIRSEAIRAARRRGALKCCYLVFGRINHPTAIRRTGPAFRPISNEFDMYKIYQLPSTDGNARFAMASKRVLTMGSGRKWAREYIEGRRAQMNTLKNTGTRTEIRNFVKRAISHARNNDFSTDGDINVLSVTTCAPTRLPGGVMLERSELIRPTRYPVGVADLDVPFGPWVEIPLSQEGL